MMKKGKLIIIESGTDGSGKATQSECVYNLLKEEGFNVRKITFPNYGSRACGSVEMYLNGEFGDNPSDINPYTASTFFAIDRYASYKTDWEKFYNDGGIVISDRYVTSNMVHQAAKMSDKEEIDMYLDWLGNLEYKYNSMPEPDCVIFLDVPISVSKMLIKDRLNKITGKEEKDIHEKDADYLEKSYKNAIYIADKYKWDKIKCVKNDTMRNIDEVTSEIMEILMKKILKK